MRVYANRVDKFYKQQADREETRRANVAKKKMQLFTELLCKNAKKKK